MAAFSGELLEYARNISGEAKEKLKQYAEEGVEEIRGDFIRCKNASGGSLLAAVHGKLLMWIFEKERLIEPVSGQTCVN